MLKIAVVDDDMVFVNKLSNIIAKTCNQSKMEYTLQKYSNGMDILSNYSQFHLIFLDIEMPEMNGLAFANHLEELHIDSKIVFLTAYSRYALEAWRTSAIDYILKPFDQSQLERALSRALPDIPNDSAQKALFFRCFPKFELLINGEPKAFQSKRAKELLAYLIHNQCCWVSIGTLVYDLFGDLDEKSCKSHYRVILARLKKELSSCHMEHMIETRYGFIRVNIPEKLCDYYMLLAGYNDDLFHGEYMQDYSWAEIERSRLIKKYSL